MKKGFTIIFALFITLNCASQILLNVPTEIQVGELNFNQSFIFKNKIKSIDVFISEKPDGEMISSKGEKLIYRFNDKGYLRRHVLFLIDDKNQNNKNVNSKEEYFYDTINIYAVSYTHLTLPTILLV